jgi:hypothetical protein
MLRSNLGMMTGWEPLEGVDWWKIILHRIQKKGSMAKNANTLATPALRLPAILQALSGSSSDSLGLPDANITFLYVYTAKTKGTIRYITASVIKSTFRIAAAHHVYKLDPIKDSDHLC